MSNCNLAQWAHASSGHSQSVEVTRDSVIALIFCFYHFCILCFLLICCLWAKPCPFAILYSLPLSFFHVSHTHRLRESNRHTHTHTHTRTHTHTHTHTLTPQSTQRAQVGDYGRTLNLNSHMAGSECWWGDLPLWRIIIQCPTWLKHRRAPQHICNCVPQERRKKENTHSYTRLKHKLKVAMFFFSSLLTTTGPWPLSFINLLLFNL